MKRILIMMITLFLIFGLPVLAFAERVPVIIDDADLLNDDEEGELFTVMLPVCDYATPIFWSTAEEHDMSSEELASELFRRKIEDGEGILFLVDLSEHVIIIHSTEQLHQIVTPSEENEILGQSLQKIIDGDFLGGAGDSTSATKLQHGHALM